MTHSRCILLIPLFALLGSTQAAAQPRTLTLEQAVQIAVRNNRQLAVARLEMDKADARVREAVGTALPSVSGSASYARAIKKSVFFLPEEFLTGFHGALSGRVVALEVGADNSMQMELSATQILYNQMVFTGVGASRIYQDASRELYRNTYNGTVASVRRAYYGAQFARSMHAVVGMALKNAEDNLATIRILNRQGLVSDYDFIRAEVQVDNARPSVIEAERNVVLAANGLKMLLGMSPDSAVEPAGELQWEPEDSARLADAETAALARNAGLRALEFQGRVSDAMVSLYRAESYPTLAAFGNYTWQAQSNSFQNVPFARSAMIGLNLSINLFNGLQSRARVSQAQIESMQAQEQLRAARDGIVTQVQNVRLKLQESRRRIESLGRTVAQAEKGYGIAQTRYSSGSGTLLEINDADLALQRAHANRLQAIFDYNVAQAELDELLSAEEPTDE
jgi:outer membrane protein TolC